MPRKYLILMAVGTALLVAGIWATMQSEDPESASSFPVRLTDDFGSTVTVSAPPQRIVTLAPQHTETLFALGAGERLVGVSSGETYPAQAMVIDSMMTMDGLTPDPQKIIRARAELVIAATDPSDWADPLRQAGIAVVSLRAASVQEALDDIGSIGMLIGKSDQADKIASTIASELEEIQRSLRDAEPVPAFVESFYPPLLSISKDGYTHDLVRRAKVEAVGIGAPDTDAIAAAAPRFYLAPSSTAPDISAIRGRPGFMAIEAVAQGRVTVVDDGLLFRPGPRIAEAVRQIARAAGHTLP